MYIELICQYAKITNMCIRNPQQRQVKYLTQKKG